MTSAGQSPAWVALSDNERLVVGCMRLIARNIAEKTHGLDAIAAEAAIERQVEDVLDTLGAVSDAFAQETARYLRLAIRRARSH